MITCITGHEPADEKQHSNSFLHITSLSALYPMRQRPQPRATLALVLGIRHMGSGRVEEDLGKELEERAKKQEEHEIVQMSS